MENNALANVLSAAEAQTAVEYLAAAVSLAPGIGDVAGKLIKAAEKALTKGDVAEASRLINKASGKIEEKVVANGNVDGVNFRDTNQGARPAELADVNKPTLYMEGSKLK